VAFWKALELLYRLVVVSRHNIDLLPIISTREGVRIRISRPKSASNSEKEEELTILLLLQPSPLSNSTLQLIARPPCGRPRERHSPTIGLSMMDWHGRRSQKAPALMSDVNDSWHERIHQDTSPKAAMNMIG